MPPKSVFVEFMRDDIDDVISKIDSTDYPEFRDVMLAIEGSKLAKYDGPKPVKPFLKSQHTSKDVEDYAVAYRSYALEKRSYDSRVETIRAWNMRLDQLAQKIGR